MYRSCQTENCALEKQLTEKEKEAFVYVRRKEIIVSYFTDVMIHHNKWCINKVDDFQLYLSFVYYDLFPVHKLVT